MFERVRRSRLQPPGDELCSLRLWVLFIIQSLSNAVLPSAEVSVLARHKRACFMWKSELDQLKLGDDSQTVKAHLKRPVAACADAHVHLAKMQLTTGGVPTHNKGKSSLNFSVTVNLGSGTFRSCRLRRAGTPQLCIRSSLRCFTTDGGSWKSWESITHLLVCSRSAV